mgnify:CR=1 FL=1
MTDASRWQRIEEVFHAVADLAPGPALEVRIDALCDGDQSVAVGRWARMVGLGRRDERGQ